MRKHLRQLGTTALLAAALGACTTVPVPTETLAAFELLLPDTASYGLPFDLTVRAVGSEGTAPFTDFSGPADLTSDLGLLTHDGFEPLQTLDLANGTGTVKAVPLGATGTFTLTASGGGAIGSGIVSVEALTEIPGDPTDPLEEAIPNIPLIPRDEDYTDDHPDLAGVFISHNTLALVLELGTTVGEANTLLATEGAELVAGVSGENGASKGIMMLRLPTADHPEMIARLEALLDDAKVAFAVQDALLEIPTLEDDSTSFTTSMQPRPNGGTPSGWTWETTPTGGNWGLERIRVPQMWNLNAALEKKHPGVATLPITGVFDVGFVDPKHADVNWVNRTPASVHFHGVHVAGIIHATHDNGAGVDGVNPFTTLRVSDYKLLPGTPAAPGSILDLRRSWGEAMTLSFPVFLDQNPSVKVINVSLGYNWGSAGFNTIISLAAQTLANQHGGVLATALAAYPGDLPLITAAAANDSNDISDGAGGFISQLAVFSSPFTNAALGHNVDEIIVVESITIRGARSPFSNLGGFISAPGSAILSTSIPHTHGATNHPGNFSTDNGTSMAAPFVAGLIGYLYALDDTLSHQEIRSLLFVNSAAVIGGGSDHIDAFDSALDIDRVQGSDAVLRMLLDIDDGSPDGNQRVVIGTTASTTDADEDGIADGALADDRALTFLSGPFTGEDADADGGIGDSRIDMADFRRWRDWLLQVEADAGLTLDGGNSNSKRDVNGNSNVEAAAAENVFPQGDFNGDGRLDRTDTSFVPGAVIATTTDLGVLETLFNDPHYNASDLEGLIDSMDLTVWPKGCFDLGAFPVAQVVSSIHPQRTVSTSLDPALFTRTHGSKDNPEMFTLALLTVAAPQGYTARVEARDGAGDVVGIAELNLPGDSPLELGGDVLFDECDPKPLLSSVTANPTGITAIPGPTEVFTEFDFTLEFDDAGKNLEIITPIFALGDTLITPTPLAVDDDSVSGFENADTGPGTVTFDLLVFCSETGENPLTAIFTLTDEFDQITEEKTFDIPVDYSGCPSVSRNDSTSNMLVRSQP